MIVRAVLICVSGALLGALLARFPELRMGVTLAAGLCAVALCLSGLGESVNTLREMASQAGLGGGAMASMLRAMGVAALAEFGAQLCRDAGESALAGRVELAGRVTLLGIALPLLADLTGRLGALLP